MEKDQRKYALERLDAIYDDRVQHLQKPLQSYALTSEKRVELIRSGKVKFIAKNFGDNTSRGGVYSNCFDFSKIKHPECSDYMKGAPYAAFKEKHNKLKAEYQRIKDELILGDALAAHELLKEFMSFKG